ncbi:MAG: HD domain-containing phosphohydrolase [Bacillota bacterium]
MVMAQAEGTIMIVEDEKANVDILLEAFKDEYQVMVALDGETALKAVTSNPPDLILLDIMLPGMNGYQVCKKIKSNSKTSAIPIIFATTMNQNTDERKGLELGAIDYITKPFNIPIVKARVENHLELKKAKEKLKNKNYNLEQKIKERTKKLEETQEVAIESLAALAETRDNETGQHIMRTKKYVKLLAEFLQDHPRFRDYLTTERIEWVYKTAPLHDIGKVGVPDKILYKEGKLTAEEFEVIKKHPTYGEEAIENAENNLGNNSFLTVAQEIVATHHEKWDGSGYPKGLQGEEIPIGGRLMAIADVYDALVNKRVYKPAFSHQRAVEIITEGDGRTSPQHFDPAVLNAFISLQDKFEKIAQTFR